MTTHYNEGNGMKTASHGCRMRAAACQGSVLDTNTHFGDAEIQLQYVQRTACHALAQQQRHQGQQYQRKHQQQQYQQQQHEVTALTVMH